MNDNTLFLRLAGPMQSWGTASRLQVRRTDKYPSKSGVLGLLLCAKGVRREKSEAHLPTLASMAMGVRVDRAGTMDWDYHTAGAKIGIWQADRKKLKRTARTGEYETLLSRRQYLWDASFLVALQGEPRTVQEFKDAMLNPVWPVFLGRKCCVPTEPVFAGTGRFDSLQDALSSMPWQPRLPTIDSPNSGRSRVLECFIERASPAPADAQPVYDEPRGFAYYNHAPRWVMTSQITVPVGDPIFPCRRPDPWTDPYGPAWDDLKRERRKLDHDLCVFCKSPAEEVHHLDYQDVRIETIRSLCKLCHDACTSLEYGRSMRRQRIDPADPQQRERILSQIARLLSKPHQTRRRELLEQGRSLSAAFFDVAASL